MCSGCWTSARQTANTESTQRYGLNVRTDDKNYSVLCPYVHLQGNYPALRSTTFRFKLPRSPHRKGSSIIKRRRCSRLSRRWTCGIGDLPGSFPGLPARSRWRGPRVGGKVLGRAIGLQCRPGVRRTKNAAQSGNLKSEGTRSGRSGRRTKYCDRSRSVLSILRADNAVLLDAGLRKRCRDQNYPVNKDWLPRGRLLRILGNDSQCRWKWFIWRLAGWLLLHASPLSVVHLLAVMAMPATCLPPANATCRPLQPPRPRAVGPSDAANFSRDAADLKTEQ
jgi:hypothetical protein